MHYSDETIDNNLLEVSIEMMTKEHQLCFALTLKIS